jgi:hypothetical protein
VTAALPAPAPALYAAARALAERAPLPAVTGTVRYGTAGWSDAALSRGELLYPKSAKTPEGRLRHYGEHFRLVEVDATFYALLSVEIVRRWTDWTPPTFHFDVKAHPVSALRSAPSSFTHAFRQPAGAGSSQSFGRYAGKGFGNQLVPAFL